MAKVLDFKEADPRPYAVGVTVLTAACPDGIIRLRRGEELFVVAEGRPVQRPGYRGPDEVFVIGAGAGGGKWPVMLVRVRHPEAWVGLDAGTADRMIARCRRRLIDEGHAPAESGAKGSEPSCDEGNPATDEPPLYISREEGNSSSQSLPSAENSNAEPSAS